MLVLATKRHEMKLSVPVQLLIIAVIISSLRKDALACNPYRSRQSPADQPSAAAGRRPSGAGRRAQVREPLPFGRRLPEATELSQVASGPLQGAIKRSSEAFKDLRCINNADIVLDNSAKVSTSTQDGSCAYVTPRCYEALTALAISVMNAWPKVHLRLTQAWAESSTSTVVHKSLGTSRRTDESDPFASSSLHYEGRAVDLTTSDRDPHKLGILARLAHDAGFDYVEYMNHAYVHASVIAEEDESMEHFYACFDGQAWLTNERGEPVRMSQVQVGQRVATYDQSSGQVVFTEVIGFLHRQSNRSARFLNLQLHSGAQLLISAYHVLFRADGQPAFAKELVVGDWLLTRPCASCEPVADLLVNVTKSSGVGVYAPLTATGTAFVNRVFVSNYADSTRQRLVHALFWPLRFYFWLRCSLDPAYLSEHGLHDVTVYTDTAKSMLSSFV